jgi:hypothetical protein
MGLIVHSHALALHPPGSVLGGNMCIRYVAFIMLSTSFLSLLSKASLEMKLDRGSSR